MFRSSKELVRLNYARIWSKKLTNENLRKKPGFLLLALGGLALGGQFGSWLLANYPEESLVEGAELDFSNGLLHHGLEVDPLALVSSEKSLELSFKIS